MAVNAPKNIGAAAPFAKAALEYTLKGWNVLPLPPNKKKSPPSKEDDEQGLGFTGRNGRLATRDDIDAWIQDKRWRKGNIAVRPGNEVTNDGEAYEVIGIDVDDYDEKSGAAHLEELIKTYGPLPNTWTSSARSDGKSGIRWFLTPVGYEYMGKPVLPSTGRASDSIEIVQRVHRYGLVFPSMHPDGMQYRWYDRGQAPDGIHVNDRIPRVQELAVLPERWWKFLTRNGVANAGGAVIDMQSTNAQLRNWQKKRWVDGEDMCDIMTNALNRHLEDVDSASDHHEPLIRAHWSLLRLGAEGHSGWATACHVLEQSWADRVAADQVRSVAETKYEIARSRYGTLRKIKGEYVQYKRKGLEYLETLDPCECRRNWEPPKQRKPPKRPTQYERNEDGNAQHFLHLNRGNVRFVPNYPESQGGRWMLFRDGRWVVDNKETLVRHMFRRVKTRQQRDAQRRLQLAAAAVAAAGGTAAATPAQKAELAEARAWVAFALESGNKARVSNSLAQAQSFPDIALLYEELDNNPMLLPVANGVIRFHTREEVLAGAKPFEWVQDPDVIKHELVTQNTHVPYIPLREQKDHPDAEVREGYKRFWEYMNKFLRSQLGKEAWEYTLKLLGVSILGVNTKKAVFLVGLPHTGKSTLQNMMDHALGDLSIWREPAVFEDTTFKSALAEALSRRVMMVGELGQKHIDAGLFKRITGGDEVSCQLKNINKPVTLKPRCTIISGCNQAPEVPDVDEATKERFVVVPFRHQVTDEERDPNAIDDLPVQCRFAMLATLVEFASRGLVEGVHIVPDELQFETKEFVSSLSELSDFLKETVVPSPPSAWKKYARNDRLDVENPKPRWPDELCLGDRDLYKQYERWCTSNGIAPSEKLSKTKFTRKLKDSGWVQDGSWTANNQRRWLGWSFAPTVARVKRAD